MTKGLDFNAVPPPVDVHLSAGANVLVRAALEAGGTKRVAPRLKAIAALDAACAALGELAPDYAAELCAPLHALAAELREMKEGGAPGEITRPLQAGRRRYHGDKADTIARQARAVLAVDWLRRIGVKPNAALRRVAAAGYGTFKQIDSWRRYFKRDLGERRRDALAELRHDIEITHGVDVEAATEDEIIAWLGRI